jgi:D-alanyl-D-alanine carboxypeptidase
MLRSTIAMAYAVAFATVPASAATPSLQDALKADLQHYLQSRAKAEHVSASSLTVSFGDGTFVETAAGTTAVGGVQAVSPNSLFQIGSNTKAFTGVLTIKLQSQGKLKLSQTVGDWLPQYPQWKNVKIRRLLDMTSGISTYDDTMAWQSDYAKRPTAFYTPQQLIAYVTDKAPLKGWNYSNTGYMLDELIIEKASGMSYQNALRTMVLQPSKIANLYYYPGIYPVNLRSRTVSGYFANNDDDNKGLAPLLGKSMRDDSLSWAQSAGGIVASTHAMALWARDMYRGDILTASERADLESLISTATTKPVAHAMASDPRTFGFGVRQMYKPGLGTFWFYEGMTLGYRMLHCYFPEKNLVIAVALNSQPRGDQNRSGDLIRSIVETLAKYGKF